MIGARLARIRARWRLLGACCGCSLAAAIALGVGLSADGVTRAGALSGAPDLVAQTDDSVPAKVVTLFGAAPGEAAGEVWGMAPGSGGSVLVRYSQASGWAFGPPLLNAGGEQLSNFQLDTPEAFRHREPSPLSGQMTAAGSGAMLGTAGSGSSSRPVLLVRNPGGPFQEAAIPEGEEVLHAGESLFGRNRSPLVTALDEAGGGAGALVVPVGAGGIDRVVLRWSGTSWTREPIEVPLAGSEQFEVLAISASSPASAWLLGRLGGSSGALTLFRRTTAGPTPAWKPVTVKAGGEAGEAIELAGEKLEQAGQVQSQLLTATSSGLWVDGRLRGSHASTTLFFTPEGEAPAGSFTGSWCLVPASSSGVPPLVLSECQAHPLPEPLPTDFSRSFAWPGSGGYGERIIAGLPDGQLMRLDGSSFALVNSLGGDPNEVRLGAAFVSNSEGWLGKELLPVHLTAPANAVPSRLAPWPVPFRFALTALAPQPGAAVGAESSEVLAVGDRGEVARYHPGQGWFPETLPGPGGQRQTPRLRAVAWPTPARAYAVGDSEKGAGQMWLWRGETGLWEKDPAAPVNFRGNLLGIAFDPNNSARGYAVGQQGVLLSYGKSWTQEEEGAIPAAARGASFTAIAFAGSEAIVAWRKLLHPGQNEYAGGVIVNSGSGWHEDEAAAAVLGTKAVPWAIAALPDGGAAFTARSSTQGALIYERNAPAGGWQPVVYPGGEAPGSLLVFREAGALRAIGTGSEPGTFSAEEETAPPPGFPPLLVDPYPLVSDSNRGVLRQTATGWSDEEHELNDAREPPGGYVYWDTPKVPDPANALLVDPSGSHGWAVGGIVNNNHALLDTADIYRYPADGKEPPGKGQQLETTSAGFTAVAVAGGAGCTAPCHTRSDTGIGPAVWMASAITEAGEIGGGGGGIGAFLYTGPGVTNGQLAGPPLLPVPWQAEENYYAQRASAAKPLVCAAPSPSDREGSGQGSEAFFEEAFKEAAACRQAGSHGASYAFQDGALRVIVLDTSLVQAGQRELTEGEIAWLGEELAGARGHAIVVGNADLPQEYAEGHQAARELVAAMNGANAPAAYFFDAPEQNVQETLTGSATATKAYGSGTLGYVNALSEDQGGFIGQSGFLVAEVANAPGPHGEYPVHVKLVPDVAELAIEAQQGTLLRRSAAASFAGLARRPRSGNRAHNQQTELETAPYIQIPDDCRGAGCARGIVPEYQFKSTNTEYGEFVKRNLQSSELNAVEHDLHGKPISEEGEGGKDGLFCAFNATPPNKPVTVTLKVGNLAYSLPVTIQAGSVRQPCGTTRLATKSYNVAVTAPPPPPPETAPAESSPPPSVQVPLPPAPSAPASHPTPPTTAHATPPAQFIPQPAASAFLPAFVPVPLPTPARPTPPSGTSPVTSPVEAAQKEEEEEAAPESVDAAASAYHPSEHETPPVYLLGLIVLAAFAGASLRGRRGPRRQVRVAPATITTSRSQRRWERERRRWWQ